MKTKSTPQKPRKLTRNAILLTITALALCASPTVALAADCIPVTSWIYNGTSSWFVAANWSPGVPDSSTGAQINNGGTANILSPLAGVACNLILGSSASNSGNVSVNGGSLAVTNEIEVGASGRGNLNITDEGTVSAGLLTIAALSSGSSGTVSVDGSTFTTSGRCDVGGDNGSQGGVALLSVTNGATVSVGNAHVYKSGTLRGNSTLSTTSGTTIEGTLEPSGGRLTIGGGALTFSSSSGITPLMECNVTPTSQDNVYVSPGAASLTGKLKVTMTGTFTAGTTYTLLQAVGGLGGSEFLSYSISFPSGQGWNPVIVYDSNNVKLNLAAITGP